MFALLNNLSIRKRLLLSISLFLLTLGAAMHSAHTSIGANIDFAAQEKKGNVYQRPLADILFNAAELRLNLAMARAGLPDVSAAQQQISAITQNMAKLEQAQTQVGEDLQFTKEGLESRGRQNLAFATVSQKWATLSQAVAANVSGGHDEALASFIADIRGMIGHSGDTSNLILDPDLDSYYLMDVTLLALPQTLDRLSVIGSTLYPLLSDSRELTEEERTKASVMAEILSESDVTRIGGDMDTSLKEDKNFYGVSASYQEAGPKLREAYDTQNKQLIALLRTAASGQKIQPDAFSQAVRTTTIAAHEFLAKGYNELDQLLDYRIQAYRGQQIKSALTSLAGIIVAMLFFFVVVRTLTKPLAELTGVMQRLASNDLQVCVPYSDAKSEIGQIAHSIQVFKDNGLAMENLKAEQVRKDQEAAIEKKRVATDLAAQFETSVGQIVQAVASASTQLQSSAQGLSAVSEQTSHRACSVSAASEQASSSVQVVAASAEELNASIGEISRRVDESARMIGEAVGQISQTNETVKKLADSSARIGDVVHLINEIAGQTNLLALNATIEAARAGEMGKGFAVVASEVKHLANQTAKATEEISSNIASMQSVAETAVNAIQSIGQIIEGVNDISGSIAAAVAQQSAATQEIAHSIHQVSASTAEVSSNIVSVTKAADETLHGSGDVLGAATDLSTQSEKLRREVDQFLTGVRAS